MKVNKTLSLKYLLKKVRESRSGNFSLKFISKKVLSSSFICEFLQTDRYKKLIKKINIAMVNKSFKNKVKISKKKINIFKHLKFTDKLLGFFHKVKKSKFLEGKLNSQKYKTNKKYDEKIGLLFYGDHNLIIASVIIDLTNNVKVIALNEIPVPANIIGDSIVEDSNELANILLDSLTLLELINSPLLIILSSSFFNIHTFYTADLKQISQSDSQIQSKSPYLPANTLVDFLRISDNKNSLVRTIYSKKDFIQSWTDTLEIVNSPIIGLVPASAHIFDAITSKITEEITILLDIESAQSTLLIGSDLAKLNSYKLPFGYSLYLTDNLKASSKSYFERALNSIALIMKDRNQELPLKINVMGNGLDKLINDEINLPKKFQSISDLKLSNYLYKPKTMKVHEIASKSIDHSIYALVSILSSCV